MLRGGMSNEDYLLTLDLEFPEFSQSMCCLLRKFHHEGMKIVQVDK